MGYYLQDNQPARSQSVCPRREDESGTCWIHNSGTAIIPPLQLANSIRNALRPGSYQRIVRPGETVAMLPDECEAFGIAVDGGNRYGFHVCIPGSDGDFHPDDPYTLGSIDQAAKEFCDYWRRQGITNPIIDRMLTADEAAARVAGVCHHGVSQPNEYENGVQVGARSDAWVSNPHRAALDRLLCEALQRHWSGAPAPIRKATKMLDSLTRTHPDSGRAGQGAEVVIIDGKVHFVWQDGGVWQPRVLWQKSGHPGSPKNDPGAFDSVAIRETADGRLEIAAVNSQVGIVFRCNETKVGGINWSDWAA